MSFYGLVVSDVSSFFFFFFFSSSSFGKCTARPACSKSYTLVLSDKGKLALERAFCLDAIFVGTERKFVYFFDGKMGDTKTIPKQSSGLGFTRPLLVECLEKETLKCPKVRIKRGVGISSITRDDKGILATLEDGTVLSGFSHCIGSDGKWSKVRQSTSSLNSQTEMITSKSWGVHLYSSKIPEGFNLDGTYVINPPKECMFYIIVSPLPTHGISISMVCYDDTLVRYPWLAPPKDDKRVDGYQDGKTSTQQCQRVFMQRMNSLRTWNVYLRKLCLHSTICLIENVSPQLV